MKKYLPYLLIVPVFLVAVFALKLVPAPEGSSAQLSAEQEKPVAERIITVGSDITEIVYALGAGDRIVATDRGASWPEDVIEKATLGQRRKLSAEGILSFEPDLILLSRNFGPPEVLDVLMASGKKVVLVPEGRDREGIREKIRLVGAELGVPSEAEKLVARSDADIDAVQRALSAIPEDQRLRVVFLHSVAAGKASGAAGGDTPAGLIIELAGGINALKPMSGYKEATAEALIQGAPDVVLMTVGTDGGRIPAEVFAVPALRGTPAQINERLIQLDASFMLGFGPRTGAAIRALALEFYPELEIAEP